MTSLAISKQAIGVVYPLFDKLGHFVSVSGQDDLLVRLTAGDLQWVGSNSNSQPASQNLSKLSQIVYKEVDESKWIQKRSQSVSIGKFSQWVEKLTQIVSD